MFVFPPNTIEIAYTMPRLLTQQYLVLDIPLFFLCYYASFIESSVEERYLPISSGRNTYFWPSMEC